MLRDPGYTVPAVGQTPSGVGRLRAHVPPAADGFPAVGTTSLGVAASHGPVDAAGETRAPTVELARALTAARLGVPVTAEVAAFVGGLGVDGVTVEDSTRGALLDLDLHAAKVDRAHLT